MYNNSVESLVICATWSVLCLSIVKILTGLRFNPDTQQTNVVREADAVVTWDNGLMEVLEDNIVALR